MATKAFYAGTESELLAGAKNFATLTSANPQEYGLSALQAQMFATASVGYSDSYKLANDPSTRTVVAVAAKNTARLSLLNMAKLMASVIELTPGVSDAQRAELGLVVKSGSMRAAVPDSAPVIGFVAVMGRTVTVRLKASASPPKAKPNGVKTATLYSYVGAQPSSNINDWKFEGVFTRAVNDIVFPNSVPGGATVWFTAMWSNSRAETGPASNFVSINIPGGGLSMNLSMAA